ncbi:MAG: DUF3592 domain-containing protein [Ruminococcus sp.]|nr:DUF3592 domain-containing protein [Ruminococcus sp.]
MNIIICILIGIFPFVGIAGLISMAISKKKCTELVEAEVVRMAENRDSDGHISYHPVFGYTYGGETFETRSSFSSSFCRFNVGDYVELYIDPDKPKNFYCPKETIHKIIFYVLFAAVGGLALVLFIKLRCM